MPNDAMMADPVRPKHEYRNHTWEAGAIHHPDPDGLVMCRLNGFAAAESHDHPHRVIRATKDRYVEGDIGLLELEATLEGIFEAITQS